MIRLSSLSFSTTTNLEFGYVLSFFLSTASENHSSALLPAKLPLLEGWSNYIPHYDSNASPPLRCHFWSFLLPCFNILVEVGLQKVTLPWSHCLQDLKSTNIATSSLSHLSSPLLETGFPGQSLQLTVPLLLWPSLSHLSYLPGKNLHTEIKPNFLITLCLSLGSHNFLGKNTLGLRGSLKNWNGT